jgi:hypothetical protein
MFIAPLAAVGCFEVRAESRNFQNPITSLRAFATIARFVPKLTIEAKELLTSTVVA